MPEVVPDSVQWRKSSRSGPNGGSCVEVATWRKSTRSGPNGGQCVEVANFPAAVAIRDSKNPDGPKLIVTAPAWSTFLTTLKSGHLDLP